MFFKTKHMKNRYIFFWIFLIIVTVFSNNVPAQSLFAGKIGGTLNDRCNAVTTDASGNIFTTGWFQGTVDFNPGTGTNNLTSYGNYDIFVCKLDPSGSYLWAKQLGGTVNDIGNAITTDASGNVYITGTFEGTADFDPGAGTSNLTAPGGNSDAFVCKLSSSGAFVWAKKFGDTNVEEGSGIALDASGNVYTTGYFSSTSVDFDPGTGTSTITVGGFNDAYISKLDASGNFVWAKAFTGPNYEEGNAIATDASGNVYITGNFRGSADFDPGTSTSYLTSLGWKDIFICKLTSAGAFSWAKRIGGANDDEGIAITTDASGNLYTTGYFMGTAVDFDPGTGTTAYTSAGSWDLFICKFTSSGTFTWAKAIGTATEDCGMAIDIDLSGNVLTTGYFYSATDFDPGAGTTTLTPAGNCDAFISKLDASGNFVWAKKMGGTSFDYGTALTVDLSGNVITAGYFQGTGDFDPGTGIANLTSAGSYDVFISKSQNTSAIYSLDDDANFISIYPNPATDKISVSFNDGIFNKTNISIFDMQGNLITGFNLSNQNFFELDVSKLTKGMYLVKIQTEDDIAVKKLVIQ